MKPSASSVTVLFYTSATCYWKGNLRMTFLNSEADVHHYHWIVCSVMWRRGFSTVKLSST